jgi:NADH-quinone oxidoreductase subunit J
METLLFFIFAAVAVICGISLVVQKHPIFSALSLVGVMGSLAILYLLLGAEFIAAAQLIVYAGAIMVLFVFVIMLLNAGEERPSARPSWFAKVLGLPLIVLLLGVVSYLILQGTPDSKLAFGEYSGGPREVGRALFTTYLLPFEITSVLILIAILGAVVLARKEID